MAHYESMTIIRSHTELIVWQKALDLAFMIYAATEKFPSQERYGLSSQIQRASVSIPSNIAEGRQRGTRKDYIRFLRIALGSAAEIETQLFLTKRFAWSKNIDFLPVESLLVEVTKMLKAMIRQLNLNVTANS